MVQSKTRVKSYKVQVSANVPEDQWIIVPGTHEAIIPQEEFETVQQLLRRDTRTAPGVSHVSIFGGYLRCADCKRAMGKKSTSQPYKKYYYYVCQTFRKGDRDACTKHTIREEKLYQAVLTTIQAQIRLAVSMDEVLKELKRQDVKARRSSRLDTMLEMKKQEHAKVSQLKIDLYPDWKSGIISKAEYLALKEKFDKQLAQIEQAVANIKEEIKRYQETSHTENQFVKHFLKYRNITELTREVIVELIEMIYVHEGGSITINFRYQDEYQRLLDLLEEHAAPTKAS